MVTLCVHRKLNNFIILWKMDYWYDKIMLFSVKFQNGDETMASEMLIREALGMPVEFIMEVVIIMQFLISTLCKRAFCRKAF